MEYPFALEWLISEECLAALKESIDQRIESKQFNAINGFDVKYFLRIYPNGKSDANRGKTLIFLQVVLGNEKKVEAEYTFSIKSANWSHKCNHTFYKDGGYGNSCCSVDELFDANKKFIIDGKFTVRVEGTFKVEKAESNPKNSRNFGDLLNMGYEDFAIIVDKNEIQVHKCVLAAHSPVFDAMFDSAMKETTESKVEIMDFSFEIVEKAVQLCYIQNIADDISLEDAALLIKFADKYDMEVLRDIIESYLGDKLTVSNVCEIASCAIAGNALILQNQCMNFLINCLRGCPDMTPLSKKKFVPNMDILEKDFFDAVFTNFSCRKDQTL